MALGELPQLRELTGKSIGCCDSRVIAAAEGANGETCGFVGALLVSPCASDVRSSCSRFDQSLGWRFSMRI